MKNLSLVLLLVLTGCKGFSRKFSDTFYGKEHKERPALVLAAQVTGTITPGVSPISPIIQSESFRGASRVDLKICTPDGGTCFPLPYAFGWCSGTTTGCEVSFALQDGYDPPAYMVVNGGRLLEMNYTFDVYVPN